MPGSRCYHTRINNCLGVELQLKACAVYSGTNVSVPSAKSTVGPFEHANIEAEAPGATKPTQGTCDWTYPHTVNGTQVIRPQQV